MNARDTIRIRYLKLVCFDFQIVIAFFVELFPKHFANISIHFIRKWKNLMFEIWILLEIANKLMISHYTRANYVTINNYYEHRKAIKDFSVQFTCALSAYKH